MAQSGLEFSKLTLVIVCRKDGVRQGAVRGGEARVGIWDHLERSC